MPELKFILVFIVILAVIVVVAIEVTNGSASPSAAHGSNTISTTTIAQKRANVTTTISIGSMARSSFESYLQKFNQTKNVIVKYSYALSSTSGQENYYKLWNNSKVLFTSGNPTYFAMYYVHNTTTYCGTYGTFNGGVICQISNKTSPLFEENILIPEFFNNSFLYGVNITNLGSNSVYSRGCNLFKINIPQGKYQSLLYNSSLFPKSATGTIYLCMDDQYGYPSFFNETYTYHSNVSYINNTVPVMQLLAYNVSFGTTQPKDLVIPATFTLTNSTNCTRNYIKFNFTPFVNMSRPILNLNYSYYNKTYAYNTINQSVVLNGHFSQFHNYREDILAYQPIPHREIMTFCMGGYCLNAYCNFTGNIII